MKWTCASCKVQGCIKAEKDRKNMPANCPTVVEKELMDEVKQIYLSPEINRFYVEAGAVGMLSKGKNPRLPRVMEALELCKRMGYHHIGIASCIGFAREADYCARIFRREGFDVETVICSCGGLNELELGCDTAPEYWDGENFSIGCNPIGQAKLLEKAGTEFNLVLGLCVGHDALFMKYSPVLCTTITVKERAFPHNPEAGIFYAYGCMGPKNGEEK